MYTINIEVSVPREFMELLDLTNAVAIALANSSDMEHAVVHRITVEEADA